MDITKPLLSTISSASFSFLSTEDIKKISVKKIQNANLLDNTNSPTTGGLYDPALGPMKKNDLCATCHLNSFRCPGHFGHIELPAPVYHPLFMVNMFALLKGTCLYCHKFRLPELQLTLYTARLQLLEYGLLREAQDIEKESLRGKPLPASGKAKKAKKATKKKPKSKKKSKKDDDEEVGDDEEEEEDFEDDEKEDAAAETSNGTETIPAFRSRIRSQVKALIQKAIDENGGKSDLKGKGKDRASAIYAERKRTIAQFIKAVQVRKCGRCKGVNPTLTKDGHIKITETDISAKQKTAHQKEGISRPNELELEAELLRRGFTPRRRGSFSEASDSDGSEAMEDNRMEEDEFRELPEPVNAGPHGKQAKKPLTPSQCRAHLRLLFDKEAEICGLIYGRHGPFESGNIEESKSSSSHLSKSTQNVNNGASADVFFMEAVFVAPTRFRPASVMGDTTFENPQNELLTKIINTTFVLKANADYWTLVSSKENEPEVRLGETATEQELEAARISVQEDKSKAYQKFLESLVQLQIDVNSFIDSSKNPNQAGQGRANPNGVKQTLEKKEGLFRKHMMGKRVNYAARSVISPDVNIETNEIGVPPVFAKKLTFPEPVTKFNVEEMRQLVINGPQVYPGAVSVRSEDGTVTLLPYGPPGSKKEQDAMGEREAIASQLLTEQENTSRQAKGTFGGLGGATRTSTINKQVLRHLKDGDILLLNRQPTLHKPSMMAHKAKVLLGEKTIRMHYANCNSYNADFDGDEMNMHFPQSQTARAECYHIANTDNQYLVPTSGNPLRGLIQDHVVAGVWMTCKDSLFDREEYQQLLYGALRPENNYTGGGTGRVNTVSPAIWKPKPLWTGKQIITTVLLNLKPADSAGLTMNSKAKVAGRYWGKDHAMEEKVIFENGELLSGVLDKSQFGASAYGVVHAVFEIYGPEYAGKLLSILSRLFTKFLQHKAFSCRMDDLLLSSKGDEIRAKLLRDGKDSGMVAAMKSVGLEGHDSTKSETDRNLRYRLEEVLREDDKLAALDAEMMSAANKLTSSIIDACIPDGLDRIFPHNNMQMMTVSGAKGSPVNVSQISCLLGSQALEGRRVPVMVSGKTLPSFKPFDTTSRAGGFIGGRFLTGIRPQEYYFHCMAGREGLIDTAVKTSRSGYLQRCLIKHLEGVTVHYDHTVRNSDGTILQFHYGEDALDVTKSKYLDQFDFTAQNFESLRQRHDPQSFTDLIGNVLDVEAYDAATKHMKKAIKKPEKYGPVLSEFSPARFFGATSERFAQDVEKYIEANANRLLEDKKKKKKKSKKSRGEEEEDEDMQEVKIERIKNATVKVKQESFRAMTSTLYQRSLVEPGEAVGLLAAQGVGEPSTQMTLNTFHFAGHGAANVTLGIPRLREIVMTASQKIQTPIMKLPLKEGIDIQSTTSKLFCKDGSRLLLSQVTEKATVTEKMLPKSSESNFERKKLFNIRLDFFPSSEYLEEYNVKPVEILRALADQFVPNFEKELKKELKKLSKEKNITMNNLGVGQKPPSEETSNAAQNDDSGVETEVEKPKKGKKGKEVQPVGRPVGADDDSDSDEEQEKDEGADGDADDEKRKSRAGAAVSYDDDPRSDDSTRKELKKHEQTEDELMAEFEGEDKDGSGSESESEDENGDASISRSRDVEITVPEKKVDPIKKALKDLQKRLGKSTVLEKAEVDEESYEWVEFEMNLSPEYNSEKILLVKVVEKVCTTSVVHEIPKISRILAPAPTPGQSPALTAEGINFKGIWEHAADIVDLNQINTNDIGALLHTYGVEAARAGIVAEMAGIFKTYGIGVSMRHLYLIADYQTSAGGFRPFSRIGMQDASSPLLKASFEMTMKFLGDSVLYGETDELDGPSANIVVGRPVHSGTGAAHVHLQTVNARR